MRDVHTMWSGGSLGSDVAHLVTREEEGKTFVQMYNRERAREREKRSICLTFCARLIDHNGV